MTVSSVYLLLTHVKRPRIFFSEDLMLAAIQPSISVLPEAETGARISCTWPELLKSVIFSSNTGYVRYAKTSGKLPSFAECVIFGIFDAREYHLDLLR